MKRAIIVMSALVGACGNKAAQDVCSQSPPPPACAMSCSPSGPNTCPTGFFCSSSGTCTAECTPGGNECGADEICTADGHCVSANGPDASMAPDADCPAVHFTPMKTTPSVELLLDRSGSMKMSDIAPTRYGALHTALTGNNGAVKSTQGSVLFGAALFSGAETPCPPNANLDGFSVPRALNNASAIDALITANPPNGSTPTAVWVTAVAADFAANPPPAGSPPIILLATDGEPNGCGTNTNDNGASVAAAQAAFASNQHIRLFIIGLAGIAPQFLQDMANAGAGMPTGQAPNCAGCAPFFTANDPTSLANGLNQIIGGVISCDLTISGQVDPATASQGTVTLNGVTLQYGTDWTVDPNGMVIHLKGAACNTLKTSSNPTVDASFPCGVIVN